MAINSNIKVFPVSWLVDRRKEGSLDTDISIQRQAVWSHLHQSNLIAAMLNHVPISNLWLEKDGKKNRNDKFKVIDGKQRTLTLTSYLADGFPLSNKMRYKTVDGYDIVGKKFSELDYELKNRLQGFQLSFTIFDAMDADERALVFFMGNQCMPLNNVQFLPVVLGELIMDEFNELCVHPFMIDKIKFTTPALRKRDDLKLIVQYLILQSAQDIGFQGKEIVSFCDGIRSGGNEVSYGEVKKVLDYLQLAMPKKRAYLKIVHMPIMMHVAQKAMEQDIAPDSFGRRLDNFFTSNNEEYKGACRQGSAKKTNVQIRVNTMSAILGDEYDAADPQVNLAE
jgi:hypothetical protein